MRSVNVTYKADDTEQEGFHVVTETLKDGSWVAVPESEGFQRAIAGQASKTYILDANERLVIEASGMKVEMVFDPANNAAMSREAFDTQPTLAQRQQTEADRQEEVRGIEYEKGHAHKAAKRAAEVAVDKSLATSTSTSTPVVASHSSPKPTGGLTSPGGTGGQSTKNIK